MNELVKKYGFWTTTAMVIGIVIGSGVFFKADDVLKASGGSLPVAIIAWLIGGIIMVVTAYVFSKIATKVEKINGIVDYFEAAYGKKAGYYIAWFMSNMYYTTLAAVLAWVAARYTCTLFNIESAIWIISFSYLALFYLLNILSPVIAGKFQISTTIIKLIPLATIGIVGLIYGLVSGQSIESFKESAISVSTGGGLAVATLSTAFAYEGWIIATTINSEIKDAKKTLPRALVFGTIFVMCIYILYYLGISGVLTNQEVLQYGDDSPIIVISKFLGDIAGTVLTVFVVISCLGTLNGIIMGATRGYYSIAVRDMGVKRDLFKKINPKTNSCVNSGIVAFVISLVWLTVWYGNFAGWFGGFMDISELPIAYLYLIYIAIYIWVIRTFKELNIFARFIAPLLATAGSLYIIWGAMQKDMFIIFSIILLLTILVGYFLSGKKTV
ncbi:MAG: APC family permease [Spirochaetaceae bacterium]